MNRGDIYIWSRSTPRKGMSSKAIGLFWSSLQLRSIGTPNCRWCFQFTSGGEFHRRIGFAVPLSAVRTMGVVRCDQPRVLDLQARGGRRVESLPAEILDDVLARTATLFM